LIAVTVRQRGALEFLDIRRCPHCRRRRRRRRRHRRRHRFLGVPHQQSRLNMILLISRMHAILTRYVAVRFGAVQRITANVALVVVAVDLGTAAGQATGSIVRARRQYHRAGILLLRQRWRRTVQVAAGAAVQGFAGRALSAGHDHTAQRILVAVVVVETGSRATTETG